MAEEKKTGREELDLEQLEQAAGGTAAGEGKQYKCMFCGNMITVHSNAELMDHLQNCKWNPHNTK